MAIIPTAGYPQSGGNRTRRDAITEIAEYVGGSNKPDVRQKAANAWAAAVREFNSVAWKFNRITDDVLVDSPMASNAAAPTVASTGSGTGFTLSTGKTIRYWIEERVKEGNRVLSRNDAPIGTVVTLTGAGAVVKPVVTRPAVVNPDATHWGLFATATSGAHASTDAAWPHGAEIAEVVIATTTIEDTRIGLNPGVPTGGIYHSGEFDLVTDFRNPVRALAVDGSGQQRYALVWVPYRAWLRARPWQITTGSNPVWYTARNVHETGKVTFDPRPGPETTYPIVRMIYDRRIAIQANEEGMLDVPQEVDEAIFQLGVACFIEKVRTFEEARMARATAFGFRIEVENEHRDFEDFS